MQNRTMAAAIGLLAALVFSLVPAGLDAGSPWPQIGAKAGADYQGDGLAVTTTAHGARLRCVFQRLEGEATREGLWLISTTTNAVDDRFSVVAVAVGRQAGHGAAEPQSVETPQTLQVGAMQLPHTG